MPSQLEPSILPTRGLETELSKHSILGDNVSTHNHDGINSDKISSASSGDIYTDRGDPAGYDTTTFTRDGAYHDLDLSALIPIDTKLVRVILSVRSSSEGDTYHFKEKGNTNQVNAEIRTNTSANNYISFTLIVPVGDDRTIEYKFPSTVTNVNFAVGGWWV